MTSFKLALAAAVVLVAGCATTQTAHDVSPSFTWHDDSGKSHYVTGTISKTLERGWKDKWYYKLDAQIDGKPVISGYLDPYSFQGNISGVFDGKPAISSCTSIRRAPNWFDVTCELAVDGSRIGALKF